MNETPITVIGNLTGDPELRFTASGQAVTTFTVASTPRTLNRSTGEWQDGEALFLRCSLWRQPAEHAAESLHKGDRVMVSGRLRQRTYETREGEKRQTVEVAADEVGASLRYAAANLTRQSSTNGRGPLASVGAETEEPPF